MTTSYYYESVPTPNGINRLVRREGIRPDPMAPTPAPTPAAPVTTKAVVPVERVRDAADGARHKRVVTFECVVCGKSVTVKGLAATDNRLYCGDACKQKGWIAIRAARRAALPRPPRIKNEHEKTRARRLRAMAGPSGALLRQERQRAGLGQRALAAAAGIGRSTLHAVEIGAHIPEAAVRERVLATIRALAPEDGRRCQRCSEPIPLEARASQRYCGDRCRTSQHEATRAMRRRAEAKT